MSFLALIVVHWTLSQQAFSFTPKGIEIYLSALSRYKALFTATVATIAAYFGFHRLNAATDANVQKLKQDRFTEWKSVLDVSFIEIEKYDPFMKKRFIRVRHKFYEQLYPLNFNIQNKSQLTHIFDATFRPLVNFFEQQNEKHIGMGGAYLNDKHSYSYDSYRFLFLGCVDDYYDNIEFDLHNLYLSCLPPERQIDAEMHNNALRNFRTTR